MKDRVMLLGWLLAVIAITMLHSPALLAALLAVVMGLILISEGRSSGRLMLRAVVAVAVVNLAVSAGFAISAWWQEAPWVIFVLRLNLRVLLIAMLTLWMARHVRVEQGFAFNAGAKHLVVLIQSQIRALSAVSRETRYAFESRNPIRARWRDRLRGAGGQVTALIDKAETHATGLNEGMRSRGYFDTDLQ